MKIEVDTKDFDIKLKEYMKYTKRTVPKIISTKLYYIARNATLTTVKTPTARVRMELLLPSRVNADVPLAAILVQKKRKQEGNKGLHGDKMRVAVDKFIRGREKCTAFLRSGWIPAIKKLALFADKVGQPAMDSKVKPLGAVKGGAEIPLERDNWVAEGEIWNSVYGGDKKNNNPDRIEKLLTEGLQEAIKMETASMEVYIKRKMDELAAKFNTP